ncbi:MAG: hypothetical protein HOH68_13430 [Rhodobacteraceae bacterium]|nr:hypothetical protein [Paracoccaceae bacterium]
MNNLIVSGRADRRRCVFHATSRNIACGAVQGQGAGVAAAWQ